MASLKQKILQASYLLGRICQGWEAVIRIAYMRLAGTGGEMLRQVRDFDQPRPNWSNMLGNIEFMRFSILIRRVTDFISQIS
ncbi:MAG: hypothetical protein A2Y80_10185 [Deltaproteobacteria bacterium RBG_13_58_19]|nr:MAG: hypothetical protein A2Y80_10185 [Deltaproteobacteria bacterium RBG_13_58_19]